MNTTLGYKGDKGSQGLIGQPGRHGAKGNIEGKCQIDDHENYCCEFPGDQGWQGYKGDRGDPGSQGLIGQPGGDGAKGNMDRKSLIYFVFIIFTKGKG